MGCLLVCHNSLISHTNNFIKKLLYLELLNKNNKAKRDIEMG